MVRVPTEKRYEEHIERELNSLLDDGLQFHSKVHQRDDTWYDKESCVVGDEFIDFLKESQKETYDILQKKYGENTHKKSFSSIVNKINQGNSANTSHFFTVATINNAGRAVKNKQEWAASSISLQCIWFQAIIVCHRDACRSVGAEQACCCMWLDPDPMASRTMFQ